MGQEQFESVFEEVMPDAIGIANDYISQAPDAAQQATDIWLYMSFEDNVFASKVMYRYGDLVTSLEDIHAKVTGLPTPDETQLSISDALDPLFFDVEPTELPNTCLVHYSIPQESLAAEFSDERIERESDEPYNLYMDRWAAAFARRMSSKSTELRAKA